jgi:hypothetical protein
MPLLPVGLGERLAPLVVLGVRSMVLLVVAAALIEGRPGGAGRPFAFSRGDDAARGEGALMPQPALRTARAPGARSRGLAGPACGMRR